MSIGQIRRHQRLFDGIVRPTTATIILALLVGCGPIGPISGGRLSGQEAGWPNDWSGAANAKQIQLETGPTDPHSINIWVVVLDNTAYVATSLLIGTEVPEEREWVRNIATDSRARVRVDDIVYPVQLEAIDDSPLITNIFDAYRVKYPELKKSRAEAARYFRIAKRTM